MAEKLMLADVLWKAANERLDPTGQDDRTCNGLAYSCTAVYALLNAENIHYARHGTMWDFLSELGCNTGSTSLRFHQPRGPKRQGVRYMWLLLAMHVAEDEGIEL